MKNIYLLLVLALFSGCIDEQQESLTSTLLDSAVSGVSYKCRDYEGITSPTGEFSYSTSCGEITFYIGSIVLDSISTTALSKDKKLYISELVGLERNVTSNPKIVRILQFLQSLDENNDPSDGIEISSVKRDKLKDEVINLSDDNLSQSNLERLVRLTGDSLVSEADAITHFQETLRINENIRQETRERNNTEERTDVNNSIVERNETTEANVSNNVEGDKTVPIFQMKSSFSVYEDKVYVTKVFATDKNTTLSYGLVVGYDASFFKVDKKNGSLSFIKLIDFEKEKHKFQVKVFVRDSAGNKAEKLLDIELLDIDDTAFSVTTSLEKDEYFGTQSLSFSSHIESEKFYYHFGDGVFELFDANLSLSVGKDYNVTYYVEDAEGNKGELKNVFYRVWAVIDANGSGDYASLHDAVANEAQRIWIKNGTHTDPRTIEIKYSDVIIKGESRDGAIIQKSGSASLLLVVRTTHVTVENLTLDANTYDTDDNEIWEAFGVFNSHNITLRGCKILGANPNNPSSYDTNHNDKYAVYFAGPYVDPGQPTIDRYESGIMDENNTMENNLIISYIRADATSFSMQRYGKMLNNHHIGSLISFFMNRDSNYSNNLLEDSVGVGIYVSLPAHDNIIENNTIKNSRAAGIRVEKQSDHRDINNKTLPLDPYRSGRNIIRNNKIYDTRYMGIEISSLENSVLSGNYIEYTDFNGIQLSSINDINVTNNFVVQGGQSKNRTPVYAFTPAPAGIFVDQQSVNTLIESNRVENNDSTGFEFGIRVAPWPSTFKTKILNNRVVGDFNQGAISNSRPDTVINGNVFE